VNALATTRHLPAATTAEPLADRLWRQVEHGIDRDRIVSRVLGFGLLRDLPGGNRLLGAAVRARCPLAWWCYDMPPHDWAAEARAGIATGYTAFKLKARPWFDIIEQVEAVSAATPAHAKLDLDFNALLVDAGHAKPVLTALAGYPKVAIFETPIPQTDVGGNRALRAAVPRPIAMHFDSPPFLTAVKEDVCDGFVVSGGAAASGGPCCRRRSPPCTSGDRPRSAPNRCRAARGRGAPSSSPWASRAAPSGPCACTGG